MADRAATWRGAWRVGRVGALCAALVIGGKAAWVAGFADDGEALLRGESRDDLVARRDHLLDALLVDGPPADPMMPADPHFLGEWWLVSLSMTTLAVTNLAFEHEDTRATSLDAVGGLIDRALRDDCRAFDADRWGEDPLDSLDGPNGHVGYLGHLALMLGAWRALGGDDRHDALRERIVAALVRRIDEAPHPFLETYPGETYTADNTVVLAAIGVHDLVSGDDHRALYERWVGHARRHLLDPRTGAMVSGVDAAGRAVGPGRGSWLGWNSLYLPFFAPAFAAEQQAVTERHYLRSWGLGLALREYPPGVSGAGDIDSGPVIFGLTPSGTGFGIAGARRRGDPAQLEGLLATAEWAGFTVQWRGRRHYLLAPLVGDAILLAAKTSRPWEAPRATGAYDGD